MTCSLMRLLSDGSDLQVQSHVLRPERLVCGKGLRNRERRLRQHSELRDLSLHFGLPVRNIVLPTQDVYGVDVRLQRQRWLRRNHHVPTLHGYRVSAASPRRPQSRSKHTQRIESRGCGCSTHLSAADAPGILRDA